MNKKSLLAVCVTGLVLCALVFSGPARSQKNNPQAGTPAVGNDVPDQVSYLFLFRHMTHLEKLAKEQRKKGKDGSGFQRRFQQVLDIDEEQYKAVKDIALSTTSEIDRLDQQAKVIVEAFKERYPDGALPEGLPVPPPPAELAALQQQRNEAALRGSRRIRETLGDGEFARFDEVVKSRIRPSMQRHGPPAVQEP